MKWRDMPISVCVQVLALLLVLHRVSRFEEYFYRWAKDHREPVRWYHRVGFGAAFGICFSIMLSIVRAACTQVESLTH